MQSNQLYQKISRLNTEVRQFQPVLFISRKKHKTPLIQRSPLTSRRASPKLISIDRCATPKERKVSKISISQSPTPPMTRQTTPQRQPSDSSLTTADNKPETPRQVIIRSPRLRMQTIIQKVIEAQDHQSQMRTVVQQLLNEQKIQNQEAQIQYSDILGTGIFYKQASKQMKKKLFSELKDSKIRILVKLQLKVFAQRINKNIKNYIKTTQIEQTRKSVLFWSGGSAGSLDKQVNYRSAVSTFKLYFVQKIEKWMKSEFRSQKQLSKILAEDFIVKEQDRTFEPQFEPIEKSCELSLPKYDDIRLNLIIYEYDLVASRKKQRMIESEHLEQISQRRIRIDEQQQDEDYFIEDYALEEFTYLNHLESILNVVESDQHQNYLLSELDQETRNIMLTEDCKDMDQLIYEFSLGDQLPNMEPYYYDAQFFNSVRKLYNEKYLFILEGSYTDLQRLIDFEAEYQPRECQDNKRSQAFLTKNMKQSRMFKSRRNVLDVPFKQLNEFIKSPPHSQRSFKGVIGDEEIPKVMQAESDEDKMSNDFSFFESKLKLQLDLARPSTIRSKNLEYMQNYLNSVTTSNIRQLAKKLIENYMLLELQAVVKNNPNFKLDCKLKGTPLLIYAVQAGDLETVAYFINQGVNLNAQDKDDNTALHHALALNQNTVADLLIKAGADINICNKHQQDVFLHAIKPK